MSYLKTALSLPQIKRTHLRTRAGTTPKFIAKNHPMWILSIPNPTRETYLEAVSTNGLALKYIEDQTEDICIKALSQNVSSLQYVKNQTRAICLYALSISPHALYYIN